MLLLVEVELGVGRLGRPQPGLNGLFCYFAEGLGQGVRVGTGGVVEVEFVGEVGQTQEGGPCDQPVQFLPSVLQHLLSPLL